MRAIEGTALEALILDPDGQLLKDGRVDLLGQTRHLFLREKVRVALDDRRFGGGVRVECSCPGVVVAMGDSTL